MKVFGTVMKVLAVLAAIAGAVYVAATYGDRIVAWAKELMGRIRCCCGCCGDDCCCDEDFCEESVQADEADFEG